MWYGVCINFSTYVDDTWGILYSLILPTVTLGVFLTAAFVTLNGSCLIFYTIVLHSYLLKCFVRIEFDYLSTLYGKIGVLFYDSGNGISVTMFYLRCIIKDLISIVLEFTVESSS